MRERHASGLDPNITHSMPGGVHLQLTQGVYVCCSCPTTVALHRVPGWTSITTVIGKPLPCDGGDQCVPVELVASFSTDFDGVPGVESAMPLRSARRSSGGRRLPGRVRCAGRAGATCGWSAQRTSVPPGSAGTNCRTSAPARRPPQARFRRDPLDHRLRRPRRHQADRSANQSGSIRNSSNTARRCRTIEARVRPNSRT